MNDKNLIPLPKRSQREKKKIQKMGGQAFKVKKAQEKQEKEERQSLSEILKTVIYAQIKPQKMKDMMADLGIKEGSNYFAALSASAMLHSIKKGDMNALAKVMELLGESGNNASFEEDKSFNNLIEAIKNV